MRTALRVLANRHRVCRRTTTHHSPLGLRLSPQPEIGQGSPPARDRTGDPPSQRRDRGAPTARQDKSQEEAGAKESLMTC